MKKLHSCDQCEILLDQDEDTAVLLLFQNGASIGLSPCQLAHLLHCVSLLSPDCLTGHGDEDLTLHDCEQLLIEAWPPHELVNINFITHAVDLSVAFDVFRHLIDISGRVLAEFVMPLVSEEERGN